MVACMKTARLFYALPLILGAGTMVQACSSSNGNGGMDSGTQDTGTGLGTGTGTGVGLGTGTGTGAGTGTGVGGTGTGTGVGTGTGTARGDHRRRGISTIGGRTPMRKIEPHPRQCHTGRACGGANRLAEYGRRPNAGIFL